MSNNSVENETKRVSSWSKKKPSSRKKVILIIIVIPLIATASYLGYQKYQESKKPISKENQFTDKDIDYILEKLENDPQSIPDGRTRIPTKTIQEQSEENKKLKESLQ